VRALVLSAALIALAAHAVASSPAEEPRASPVSSVVLLTLDTTRADFVGASTSGPSQTPILDALATRGTRYRAALAPSPLTLPAHASLLTGLEPTEHGVRDNGGAALAERVPTLATVLAGRGYATAAFVASRVLDRRFGLDRGFAVYDDHMAAERVCEQGYAERDARAVTESALAWVADGLPAGRPFFLWVHYYDPHAPYDPPQADRTASARDRYAAEIAVVDREIGRLLAALPGPASSRIVAAVGDHGEALGEHGEATHGIFLYRAVLEVPMILCGPGVPGGQVVSEMVATRRLTATLLRLVGATVEASGLGPGLPGLPGVERPAAPIPVYSETTLPATAYGWAPLKALSEGRWRYVAAPRPELYDLVADPGEQTDLIEREPAQAGRLRTRLREIEQGFQHRPAVAAELDGELGAALRSLGYVSGAAAGPGDGIDPKDGVLLLAELDQARAMVRDGKPGEAAVKLQALAGRNPSNAPLLTQLAAARLAAGSGEEALAIHRRALSLAPGSEFLRLNLAHALRQLGLTEEARRQYGAVLEVDPRSAVAWLRLADLGGVSGHQGEREVLQQAVAQGADSVLILLRLARLELAATDLAAADAHLAEAIRLDPGWAEVWLDWGKTAEASEQLDLALARCTRASELAPSRAAAALCIGRVLQRGGEPARARPHLRRAVVLGRGTPEGDEARELLDSLNGGAP